MCVAVPNARELGTTVPLRHGSAFAMPEERFARTERGGPETRCVIARPCLECRSHFGASRSRIRKGALRLLAGRCTNPRALQEHFRGSAADCDSRNGGLAAL